MSWKRVYNSRMYRAPLLIAMAIGLIAISCRKQEEAPKPEPAADEVAVETPKEEAAAPAATPAPEEKQQAAAEPKPIIIKDAGFSTPESVLFDDAADIYLVSNINGSPSGEDNNGFISKVSPDGAVVELKWIEGGRKETTLSAPKGMALRGDVLYVTDITAVRMFNRTDGTPIGEIAVKGASFLNDLSVAPNGTMYVSDTGVRAGEEGLVPTGKDAVYKIDAENKVSKLMGGKALNRPNGLLAEEGGVWVASFAGNEIYRITDDGKKEPSITVPGGSLDGLVRTNDGRLMVSSWEAASLFSGKPAGEFIAALAGIRSPADIGYDAKRNRVLIPVFEENIVQIQPVAVEAAPQATATASADEPANENAAPPQEQVAAAATEEQQAAAAEPAKEGLRKDAPEPETAASKAEPNQPAAAVKGADAPAEPAAIPDQPAQ